MKQMLNVRTCVAWALHPTEKPRDANITAAVYWRIAADKDEPRCGVLEFKPTSQRLNIE